MKKILFVPLLGLMLASLLLFSVSCVIGESGGSGKNAVENGDAGTDGGENGQNVMIQIIELELYPDKAPITVENFVNLAKEGFYDGLIFHRVIKNFMIQGGDPEGTGMGGSGKTIKGEFAQNGVPNDISHVRGVISMARSKKMDSASSQFFIVHKDSTYLDGAYAAFGRVTSGMDVVDEIASAPTDKNDRPVEDVVIKTIRVVE